MKSIFILLASALLITQVNAEPVELAYDSGNRAGHFDQAAAGDIEAVRFTPAHPCTLLSFRFYAVNSGAMEWHIWDDNGGNMPDTERDLIEPRRVEVQNPRNWVTVNLADAGLHFDVPQHFHIGYVKLGAEPDLYVDGGRNTEDRSSIRISNTWYITGEGSGNYLLRATVSYYNVRDEFTFVNVNQEAHCRTFSKCAWGDYDNDSWDDLLCDGRFLLRNREGQFFEDVSERAGIVANNPGGGGVWGDFDNDGWLDFYSTNHDLNGEDRLYRNNGDGTFSFVNEQFDIRNGRNPTEASGWGDADNDGSLELYVANSERWIDDNHQEYWPDRLYYYAAEFGIFVDITAQTGIADRRLYGRGVAWCDFDFDGDQDIYISNYRLHPNFLLVNQGSLRFRDEAFARNVQGVAVQGYFGHTIGSTWGDYDNDGDFDLFVGNLAHPRFLWFSDKCMLYRNNGAPNWDFTDVREAAGVKYDETASSPAWGDYDNDGWLDLFVTSVYEGRQPYLYRNCGDGTFENVNYEAGFHQKCYNSWGVAWCDYDQDGDLDVAIGGPHGGLFRNESQNVNWWLQLTLRGTRSNKFGIGSRITVNGDAYRTQVRQIEGGTGTGGCQNSLTQHFGLGPPRRGSALNDLVINWTSGQVDRYFYGQGLNQGHRYVAIEGEGLILSTPENPAEPQPSEFKLSQPYPNPFNGELIIDFMLTKPGNVRVDIFGLDGRLISRLLDAQAPAGSTRLVWSPAGQPSGTYLVQVSHPQGIASRTSTLVK
ncbi:MAG: T9SS type A sorting domain-containing protein [Calditrichaeota bacterium]|nr:T9SS type A sorting domain-containing protein [Calditrichota bacterium]